MGLHDEGARPYCPLPSRQRAPVNCLHEEERKRDIKEKEEKEGKKKRRKRKWEKNWNLKIFGEKNKR
jgi:hypothetical protein